MLALGCSSMLSCIAFGQIRLLNLLIPVLTPYGSHVVFGVLLGITDACICILRAVLTFDLTGADGECQ
ncbi:unnamed protein product [Gadus morhua 'NCC']